jgi:hypothetical protein
MQFGKSLIGAIIGAAIGVALLVVVYLQFGKDNMWLAIPVAILTGLGVRLAIARTGHASYARGALTVLIALGAYLGGLQVTTALANRKASDLSKGVARVETETDAKAATDDAKGAEDAAPVPAPGPEQKAPANVAMRGGGEMRRPQLPKTFSTWDFLALAVAALVAYELGRGSGGVYTTPASTMPSEPGAVPAGSHPDA